jgi:Fimbrial assembly protein (PilN)
MRAVNLLPKELQTRKSIREEDPAVVVGSALGVVVMIALGLGFYVEHSAAGKQQARLNTARLELAQLSIQSHHEKPKPKKPVVPITPVVPPPSISGQEATWLSAVETNLSQRIAWDRVLREVSLVMPDDVTLTALTMTAPTTASIIPGVVSTPPATGSAQGFSIAGDAFSYDSVARLLSRLSLVPDLTDVTLTNTSSGSSAAAGSAGGGSASGVQFNISANVKGAPAPPAPAVTTTPPVDTSSTTTGASQ